MNHLWRSVQDAEAPSIPFFHRESRWPFEWLRSMTFSWSTNQRFSILPIIAPASKLQRNVSIFQSHTAYMHIQLTRTSTQIKYRTIQSMLPSNVKKLFQGKKRPLNWKVISQPAGTHFYSSTVLNRRWSVSVCVPVCMHWPHTEGQEHWGCDDCFVVHML